MNILDRQRSILVGVDFQTRLMPHIANGDAIVANARRLLDAAAILQVPVMFTEQNRAGLGPTIPELACPCPIVQKATFNATAASGFMSRLPPEWTVVVMGCEAHVCVMQTVLGLCSESRHVYVVLDAVGSRQIVNKETAIRRMDRHGAEIITTEMAIFEWLNTCEHPRFSDVLKIIK